MKQQKSKILNYSVVFEEDHSGGYAVWVPDLPGCASQGKTLDEAKKNIEEAIALYLEDAPPSLIEDAKGVSRQFIMPIQVSFPAYG